MEANRFVDLTIVDNEVNLCGTRLIRPKTVDVQSWLGLWDLVRNALERRGSMRAVNDKLSMSSMDDFRRLAGTHC